MSNNTSTTRFVLGIVGMVVFGVLLLVFVLFFMISRIWDSLFFLPAVIVFAVCFVLSGLLMRSGRKRKSVIERLSRYMAELSMKNNLLAMEDMAAITGYAPAQIRNDLRLMKRLSLNFDMYTDREETTLMKGQGVYEQYLETERQRDTLAREENERQNRLRDPETATLEAFRSVGGEILDKLRAANLILPGEAISNSLSELEKTTKRIFEHIETHPEKLPETRKLMNYHLPTTLKLVEKYCQYDTLEYQLPNVAAAKTDIEKALTAANEAFANFLENLYHEDTLDVTTDAEVLTKMFEKDGLTGKKFDINGDSR